MIKEMDELLRLLQLPGERAGYRYLCEAAAVYRRTGLDGAALLSEVADACGVGFPEVNRAIVEAVRYIQAQPAGSRLLCGRSVMGVLRWMLQLCLFAEQELARAGGHGPSMSERVRILLDKSPVPC